MPHRIRPPRVRAGTGLRQSLRISVRSYGIPPRDFRGHAPGYLLRRISKGNVSGQNHLRQRVGRVSESAKVFDGHEPHRLWSLSQRRGGYWFSLKKWHGRPAVNTTRKMRVPLKLNQYEKAERVLNPRQSALIYS